MTNTNILPMAKQILLAGAALSLTGCMAGEGYYGDGFVNGGSTGYACDPYDPFDAYYSCDSGYGFANIGYGGGWYDDYFYPGYGLFIFDRVGHRHQMQNHHRRYWAHRRHQHGAQHGQRGDRSHANRARNLSPERRAERREQHGDGNMVRGGAAMSQQDLRYRSQEARSEMRSGNRQANGLRRGRSGNAAGAPLTRPTMAAEQPQLARPATQQQTQRRTHPAARRAPITRAPVERSSTVRSTRDTPITSRHDLNDE